MPIKRISPERRKKPGIMDARNLRAQYALRRTPLGIEYSKDMQSWHPEGRKIKPEVLRALGGGAKIDSADALFADKGIIGRKKHR